MEVSVMPKARTHKKSGVVHTGPRKAPGKNATLAMNGQAGIQPRPAGANISGMIMPGMVALGCWGMAFTFTVFSTDPNRLLFGGMAALMALMWSVSFGMRVRKVLRQK
jgi:hypothetical protein